MITHNHHGKKGYLALRGQDILIDDTACFDLTGNIIVGDFTHIAKGVKILTHKHDYSTKRPVLESEKETKTVTTVIGQDVFIGQEAMLIAVEKIGNGAIIGARAVVTRNIPDYEIWAGNPAVKVGERK